jgi:hypothetical protein
MQHREIFAPKYFREIAKHFHLEKDVPELLGCISVWMFKAQRLLLSKN